MPRGQKPPKAEGDQLEEYRERRDPIRTTEPFGAAPPPGRGTRVGRYVVHLHQATREHYDVRIEIGGVLWSFAVPKGPSLNPKDKRIAIHVENHPIEYLDFEGVIPKGNYGAGSMIAWDQGRIRYIETNAEDGIQIGKIDFELSGFKLNGRFALIHTGKRQSAGVENQWLLIKKTDAHSSPDRDVLSDSPLSVLSGLSVDELANAKEIAQQVEESAARLGAPVGEIDLHGFVPMLCSTDVTSLDDPNRLYELKLDGVRIVASRHAESVVLRYRQGRLATPTFPEIVRALRALPGERLVLDGEIVAFDPAGKPRFQRLAPRLGAAKPLEVERAGAEVPVVFIVFDLLQIGARVLDKVPLLQRKALLAQLVRGKGFVRALDHLEGHGRELYEFCRAERLEGVVAKRADAPYRPGPKRFSDWVKVKCERDDEFVIVGWEEGRGVRQEFGCLRLATFDGDRLILRGRAGSGLDQKTINSLLARLKELEIPECPAEGDLDVGRGPAHHVRPELVASVRFIGWSDEGVLREPVFRGLREDIDLRACVAAPPGGEALDPDALPQSHAAESTRVPLTNREKVFWPEEGYTKGDLLDYYAEVAPVLLPFLKDRPVILVRYPDGIHGKNFFQWRPPPHTPGWVRTLELRDEEDLDHRGSKVVFLLNSLDALLHIVNLGCIPIHVLASRAANVEHGEFFTIDFDLGEAAFRDAIDLALTLRVLLNECGLEGFIKTSGQTGLHVLVPVGPGIPFAITKTLAELFARLLESERPKIATTERTVSRRGTKIYIDSGQTGRGRAIVSPYSVRAIRGARVSTPLGWEEIHAALDPARLDIASVPARVADGSDPWRGMFELRPDVPRAIAILEAKFAAKSRR
jgi:bifunctional non-homologous end joining protein LigD